MSEHTPGPWVARIAIRDGWVIFADDGQIVGTEDEYGRHGAIYKGEDAYLIAAAPDLLEACKDLLNALPSATTHPAIKAARAAIAKAKGEHTDE